MGKRGFWLIVFVITIFIFKVFPAQGMEIGATYKDSTWRILLNEETRMLYCLGPENTSWSDQAKVVDWYVDKVWAEGSPWGPVLVYQKGIEFRWVILKGNTGHKFLGGLLLYISPATGFVKWVKIFPRKKGIEIKVMFEGKKYKVFFINKWGGKKLLREGIILNKVEAPG